MDKRLIELIEQAGDVAISKHIPLFSGMIAKYLEENGVEVVVNCRDCKYFVEGTYLGIGTCDKESGGLVCPDPDDFCSYGERKEG